MIILSIEKVMKHTTNKYIAMALAAVVGLSSCSKKDFDDNFYNPELSVQADIPKLFSGLLYNHDKQNANTIFPRYWNMYVFQIPMLGTYTQTYGYTRSNGRYEQATAYTQLRWQYYYTAPMASFRELEKYYNNLQAQEEKDGFQIFLEAGRVFLYDQTAQMVDMWGDIPFSEAGQLIYNSGTIINGKFDDQEEIYNFILDDLGRISDYFNNPNTPAFYMDMFEGADVINLGSIEKWRIYTNSLRLRLAMRISYRNEAKAREIVSQILNNPSQYPVVSSNDNSIKIDARGDQLRSVIGVDGIRNSLEASDFNLAPGHMVNEVMSPSNDPRLPAMFSRNAEGEYRGLDPNITSTEQSDLITANLISRMDSATYSRNDKFPGIMITAAEVSFFKAEAAERWGLGDARAAYEEGLRQSIDFIYYINALNDNADGTSYTPEPRPSTAAINAFLAHSLIAYQGTQAQRLEKIGIQQWLNFGLIQSYLAWSEYRRTKFPVLTFSNDGSSNQAPLPPNRLLYPDNERLYNTANYQTVQDKDTPTAKIFWDAK